MRNRTRLLVPAAAGLLLALPVTACADTAAGDPDALQVAAAFYPLELVAEQVGGEPVSVTGLTPPGAEPHDLELSPAQVATLAEADLVVYLAGFQPAVDDAVATHAAGSGFDVAAQVPLLAASAEDEHAEDEHAEEDGHEHGDTDPHVWLDPERLVTIADALATALGEADPAHAADYTARADTLADQLGALDAELADGLADCDRREIVVSHAAFGYLADRYQLEQIAITGLSPEDEPSPQQLAEVIHEAEQHGATTIFFEVLVSPAVADRIAEQVGATTAVLDPVEGLAPGSDGDYFSVMRENLAALQAGLGCR